MDKQGKYVQALNQRCTELNQHINKLYTMLGTVYQELQDVKKFVEYTPEHDKGVTELDTRMKGLNVLGSADDFASNFQNGGGISIGSGGGFANRKNIIN